MERGLWVFTQEGKERPPDETAADATKRSFQLRSDRAYSLIALNVEKHLQLHISGTTEPLKAWQNLQNSFQKFQKFKSSFESKILHSKHARGS